MWFRYILNSAAFEEIEDSRSLEIRTEVVNDLKHLRGCFFLLWSK